MKKVTLEVLSYFDTHKIANQLFFTSDNLAFFDTQSANAHAGNLKRSGGSDRVETVTRAQAAAWQASPEYKAALISSAQDAVKVCQDKVNAMQQCLDKANGVLNSLPKNTTKPQIDSVKRDIEQWAQRLNSAQGKLDEATAELEVLQADATAGDGGKSLPVIADTDSDDVKKAKQGVLDADTAYNTAKTALEALPRNTKRELKAAAAEKVNDAQSTLDVAWAALNGLSK